MVRLALAGAAALAVILIGLDQSGFPFEKVLRDPNATANQPWWVGSGSLLGVMGWSIAGALWGSAAWVRRAAAHHRSRTWRFLASGAALFLVAGVDDALMLHEKALSRSDPLLEHGIFVLYAAATVAWVLIFRGELRQRGLLLASLACLGTSMLIDTGDFSRVDEYFLEDYVKYVGLIGLLLTGLSELASAARLDDLRPGPGPGGTEPPPGVVPLEIGSEGAPDLRDQRTGSPASS